MIIIPVFFILACFFFFLFLFFFCISFRGYLAAIGTNSFSVRCCLSRSRIDAACQDRTGQSTHLISTCGCPVVSSLIALDIVDLHSHY